MKQISRIGLPAALVAGTALVLVVVVLIAQAGAPGAVRAQTTEPTQRTDIGVSGTGKVSVAPDTAIASIGVEITAPTLAEATQEASTRMTAVIDAIKAQGVAATDIQTTSYNVFPITSQPEEGQTSTITAYRVSNIVTVKIRDIGNVGGVLDAALTAGANSVNSVFFTVNDPSEAMDQARTLAVQDAMAKAGTLAAAAGVQVGPIISISDLTGGVQPLYRTAEYAAVPAAMGGAGPVETGQTEIQVTVEMHFEIAQYSN
jgi:uncharacterized protein YggE